MANYSTLQITPYLIFLFVRSAKQRKIRFEDDDKFDPEESEKDSRPKYKPAVSPLQVRMLQMAGQVIPMVAVQVRIDSCFCFVVKLFFYVAILTNKTQKLMLRMVENLFSVGILSLRFTIAHTVIIFDSLLEIRRSCLKVLLKNSYG